MVATFQLAGSEHETAMGYHWAVTPEVIASWLIDSWGQTEGVSPFLGCELGNELKKGRPSVPDLYLPQQLTFLTLNLLAWRFFLLKYLSVAGSLEFLTTHW